jgi:hypothetical protein
VIQRASVRASIATSLLLALAAIGCGDSTGSPGASSSTVRSTTTIASTTAPTTTARSSTTTTTDEAQIRSAFVAFFNGADRNVENKVSLLQDGEKYRQMLTDADADSRSQQLRAQVRAVRLADGAGCTAAGVSSPCAIVTFDLLLGDFPALAAHDGSAVKVAGSWKVSAKTWCDVVAIGGASCSS